MKLLDYLMIIGIILILLAGIITILYLTNKGVQCISDPIKFYQIKENVSCFCTDMINYKK
jgi:uncharacterized membrane protein YdbT with pleckstrin-like domain